MTTTQKFLGGVAVIFALSNVACSAQSSGDHTASKSESNVNTVDVTLAGEANSKKLRSPEYVKPGASVDFTHDFTGFVQPGSSGNVRVTFSEPESDGNMRVDVKSDGALDIAKDSLTETFSLKGQSDHVMNIAFSTQSPGRHYINFYVETVDAGGQKMARAFTIPIQVGDPKYNPPTPTHPDLQTMPSGEKIIAMDAEETITAKPTP